VQWLMEGVPDEIIGDFGLSGGGAAGFELDRADENLGTPENAVILASSENPPDHFALVPEEWLTHVTTIPGEPPESLKRADMIYFDCPGGGAVFSVGSITFCGSLAHGNYDNNVSRILENVFKRFLA
jgi:N,N-dimethylformamidase beta subunit-like protein